MTEVSYTSISKLSDNWHVDYKAVPSILEKAGAQILVLAMGRTGVSKQVSNVELFNKKDAIERELARYRESVVKQRARAMQKAQETLRPASTAALESVMRDLLTEQKRTNDFMQQLVDAWRIDRVS